MCPGYARGTCTLYTSNWAWAHDRHGNGANYLCLDGHATNANVGTIWLNTPYARSDLHMDYRGYHP
jgi:prepilin-type processing-associated H-X9-DG protein